MVNPMFAVFCPYQEARVLLSPSNILAMERGAEGVAIRYRCWCGHEGVHVIASDHRPAALAPVAADAAPAPARAARSAAPIVRPRPVPAPC